jgi:hypothetical protein
MFSPGIVLSDIFSRSWHILRTRLWGYAAVHKKPVQSPGAIPVIKWDLSRSGVLHQISAGVEKGITTDP